MKVLDRMPPVFAWCWLLAMVHSGFPGPNSGHASQTLDPFYFIDEICGDDVSTTLAGMGGEGSGLAMQSWGGESSSDDARGTPPKSTWRRA